jgi:tetratricopeptide (TPR) repeat protein
MCVRTMVLFLSSLAYAVMALADSPFAGDGAKTYDAALKAYAQGAYAEAAASFERCEHLASTPGARALLWSDLGIVLFKLGREEEAAELLRGAVGIWPSIPGTANEMARAVLWLVEVERTLGNFARVEGTLKAAMVAHPSAGLEAELRNRLAAILREMGKTEEARAELQIVLAMPGIAPGVEVDALLVKAELDRHAMRYPESMNSLNRALKLAYDAPLANDVARRTQADVLQGIGLTRMGLKDLSRAEPALKRSLALAEADDDSTPQRIGTALQCLAALHARQNKYAVAEQELLRALACLRKTLRDGHPQIAAVMGDLAAVYRQENRLDEARKYADGAYSVMRSRLGPESIGAAETLGVIAGIEARQNRFREASEHFELAMEILRKHGSERDARMAVLMKGYAGVLDSLHRQKEAKQVRADLIGFGFSPRP